MVGEWIDKTAYPQSPAMPDDEIISFFEKVVFARLGTLNENGTVHIAPF